MNSVLQGILSVVLISGLILSPFMLNVDANKNEIMSPRKQMAEGIMADNVKCNAELVLMIRLISGSAACVKLSTSTKLSLEGSGAVVDLSMKKEPPIEPIIPQSSNEKKTKENVIEVKINDGIGSKDK